jgi:outer membrane protein assembly factor BamA
MHGEMIKIFSFIITLILLTNGSVIESYAQTLSISLEDREILILEPIPDAIFRSIQTDIAARITHAEEKNLLDRIILRSFADAGYFSADVQIQETDDTLYILPGNRALITSITIEPESVPVYREVLNRTRYIIGNYFSTTFIELWIGETLALIENRGYPLSAIILDSLQMKHGEPPAVHLHLSLHDLEKITLHTINIEGNNETRDRTIMRQAGVFPGDQFSRDRIDNIRPRLLRTGLFRSVSEPQIFMDRTGGSLLVTVEESRFNSFDGILGYMPEPGGGGYVMGLAHITMRNLFGTMRRFEAKWQRETQVTQELLLNYREPYLAGLPVNVSFGFRQRQQDSTYVQTRTRLLADAELFRNSTIGFSYEYERVIPAEDIPLTRVQDARSHITGFELTYDSRDDAVVPRSGIHYATEYQTGSIRRTTNGSDVYDTLHRFLIDFRMYISVSYNHVFFVGLHGRESRLTQYQESDLFRLGGTRSLRGYREGQFTGSRTAWTNTEYRFMAGQRSYMFGFIDAGYYLLPPLDGESLRQDQFLVGYGGGLHVETAIGLLSVGFGFGKGDTFGNGKIHIGVINEF